MKKIIQVFLGILTAIGGYLDVGAIATTADAGATFRYKLIWPVLLSTICVIFLIEMSGRLGAVSKHPLADAVREHLGFRYFTIPLIAELVVDFLILTSEIGGVCIALQLVTGISFQWWAPLVGFVAWLLIWKGTFSFIEDGTAILGLVTICFVVAAWKLHPPIGELARSAIPHLPQQDKAKYWFTAVSISGAILSPYMFYFYSSGAVEEKWDKSYLGINRVVAFTGMTFGAVIALAIMILAALILHPAGISIDRYEQAPLILSAVLGKAGFYLFAASLGICCFGAICECVLSSSYVASQAFGWEWGEDLEPAKNARFATVYTTMLILASTFALTGIDPLKLTMFTMALCAMVLPIVVMPFLVIMNDERYLGKHTNGKLSNAVVIIIVLLASAIAIVTIPLEVFGGAG